MSKFQVCVKRMEWAYFDIDAPTEEDAYDLAIEEAYDSDWHHAFDCDYEVGTVERVADDSSM